MDITHLLLILLLLLVAAVGISVVLIAAAVALGVIYRKELRAWLIGYLFRGTEDLEARRVEVMASMPMATRHDLPSTTKHVIDHYAHKCGIVGGLLGLGGAATAVLGQPLDLVTVLRNQAEMILLIAHMHGRTFHTDDEKLEAVLFITGANQTLTWLLKTVAKVAVTSIPLAGAVVGYGINRYSTQAAGWFADKYYSDQLNRQTLQAAASQMLNRASGRQPGSKAA